MSEADGRNSIVESQSFDAFGNMRDPLWLTPGSVPVPASTLDSFTGHQMDWELGLVDMGARHYIPGLHRFLEPDSVVQAPAYGPSWNRYAYVFNNPLKYTDPTGHMAALTDRQPHSNIATLGSCGDLCNGGGFGEGMGDEGRALLDEKGKVIAGTDEKGKVNADTKGWDQLFQLETHWGSAEDIRDAMSSQSSEASVRHLDSLSRSGRGGHGGPSAAGFRGSAASTGLLAFPGENIAASQLAKYLLGWGVARQLVKTLVDQWGLYRELPLWASNGVAKGADLTPVGAFLRSMVVQQFTIDTYLRYGWDKGSDILYETNTTSSGPLVWAAQRFMDGITYYPARGYVWLDTHLIYQQPQTPYTFTRFGTVCTWCAPFHNP